MSLITERTSARNRISDDERVFRTEFASSRHRRRMPWACRSTCWPARGGKPAMIIVRAVTSDGPEASVEAFIARVGKEYPHPRVHEGRRQLWLRDDLDKAILPLDLRDRDAAEDL